MAKKKFLNENEEQIWPITRADCVYTEDGKKLLSEDYASKKYVDDSLSNHNHTLLYDIEGLYFASEETDSASIEVTKDGGNTYMDFYLDDDTNDMWRWRFGTLVDSNTAEFKIFDAMTLRAINKSESELDVIGNVRSLGLIGVSGEEWENVSRTIDQDCKFEFSSHINKNAAGLFPTNNNSNSIISFNRHDGEYSSQLGFNSNGQMYYRHTNGEAITEQTEWQKIYTDKNKPTPEDIGAATKEYVDDEITKLRDEMIVLDEDDLSIDGLIDSTFPSLETEDKTLIGAINEVNENIQNIKPAEEEIEKAVIDEMLMDVFGVVVDEEAN